MSTSTENPSQDVDDGRRAAHGVVVSLLDLADATCRLTMDDVSAGPQIPTGTWNHDRLYTYQRLGLQATQTMALSQQEYARIGEVLMAQLVPDGRLR